MADVRLVASGAPLGGPGLGAPLGGGGGLWEGVGGFVATAGGANDAALDSVAGDLLVGNLILRLALLAEKLHGRPGRLHVSKERRVNASGQISLRKRSWIEERATSSGAAPPQRSHMPTALVLKPAFS